MECFIPTGARSKIEWPDVESLLEMLRSSNFMEVSRNLGVSDNAIRRHLRRRGIDPPKRLNKKQNNVL